MAYMLLGSNRERDFSMNFLLSTFSHRLGFNSSLIMPKDSPDSSQAITAWQGVCKWSWSYYSEKNKKLNTTLDFLRHREQKNEFKRLDFQNFLITILIIWYKC